MSKAEVDKLVGPHLKQGISRSSFYLDSFEQTCGAEFRVDFHFFDEDSDKKGLGSVSLESQSGNPNGTIGNCVMSQLTAELGKPQTDKRNGPGFWWFGHRFFGARTTLFISPSRVFIGHERHRPLIDWPQIP